MSSTEAQAVMERLDRIESLTLIAAKDVLTLTEAAAYTGYSKDYLYQLVFGKQVPHYKRGKSLFFDKRELASWLKATRVATNAEIDSAAALHVVINKSK